MNGYMRALIECSFYFKIFGSHYEMFSSSTSGVDFKMKTLEIDGIKVRIQIWYVLFFSDDVI